ncbi:Glycoside hydrolase family 16 protein [Coniochaeta hoffmannii]|uniref:Glycoside hydrolase family 16 protein n=1 Tax=Coniochaeta hoffmannii TaxID=91930 RepID=A0AA38VSM0_9PEZI|nr:Glycoside hydrolase family 16 protein [Coniochaeta hoffmannii]
MILAPLFASALLVSPSWAAYVLKRNYYGQNFTSGFNFRTAADYDGGDPTGGFVNYLSYQAATNAGLVKVTNNQVYLGVDYSKKISTSAQGRDSIRMESKERFDTGLLIADIAHMPGSQCGIWPAYWTYNFDEDPYGEVDIIEYAMFDSGNTVSLHTCGACKFDLSGQPDCNLGDEAEQCPETDNSNFGGCGNTAPTGSCGDSFNSGGGGVYATLYEAAALKIWFFPRAQIPADITSGSPNPAAWSKPFVDFETSKSSNKCSVGKYFKKNTIIINTDLCGVEIDQDWWDGEPTCKKAAKDCKTFVANNPSAFAEAYWLFNSIKLYQQ